MIVLLSILLWSRSKQTAQSWTCPFKEPCDDRIVIYPFMVKKFQHLKHTGANEHLRKWKAYDIDWLRFCRKIIFLHGFEINYIDVNMLHTTVSHIHVLLSTSAQYRSDWAVYIRMQNTRLGVSVKKPNVEYFSIGTCSLSPLSVWFHSLIRWWIKNCWTGFYIKYFWWKRNTTTLCPRSFKTW